ncbi:MAG: DUF1549 domain-containing protein [Planctomycetota bacterium]
MSNRNKPHDSQYERRLEEMLKTEYGGVDPTAEFRDSLVRQLDETFSREYFLDGEVRESGATVSMENTLASHQLGSESSLPSRTVGHRMVSFRVAMSMAAAACLLLIVAVWNSQSAYGWASMLRALENCEWVQVVSETADVGGWVSSQRGVLAIKTDSHVAYHDNQQQVSSQYFAEHGVIQRQENGSRGTVRSASDHLLLLLLDDHADAADANLSGYRVVSESWHDLPAEGDRGEAIELRVTLVSSGVHRKSHKLVVRIDKETHLPESCHLVVGSGSVVRSLDFAYPAKGPSSIFELGVPRESKVIGSLAELQRETTNMQETELARIAALPRTTSTVPSAESSMDANAESARVESTEERALAEAAVDRATADADLATNQPIPQRIRAEEIVTVEKSRSVESGAEALEAEQADGEPLVASNQSQPRRKLPAVSFATANLSAAELVETINLQLSESWHSQGVQIAESASETEFLRRAYLDLTGRIPVPYEVYTYLESDPRSRREELVDQLLSSRDHATHLATVWRKLLLPDGVDTNIYGGTGKFDEWLADRFERNLPYDQLVQQLLLAEGRVSDSGPILFYAALKLNPEELAAKTARTFLGMRMECAQCHDHPFDESISQEDFWGFAAHFAQISRPKGKIEMTSSVLRVRDNSHGEVMLPDSDEVVPPSLPYYVALSVGPELSDRAAQSKSRREQLVDWLTTKQNDRFARATVNRAWQHLFGLGLVEPVDDMRADNLASCPEVLNTLSQDFAANNYDIRRLLRALVLSEAYQLSSRANRDEPSQALMFARMNIKSFSADQLYDCIQVATEPDTAEADQVANGALARFGNTARRAFIEQFQAPPGQRTDYHAGIPQALTLMHGRLVHSATDLASSGLLKSISAPFFTDEQRIETLFLSTLSRFPEQAELQKMLGHVQSISGDVERTQAFGDILWALLNSAEFTFIH